MPLPRLNNALDASVSGISSERLIITGYINSKETRKTKSVLRDTGQALVIQ